jgi:simple sugar transport system permease protein
MNIRQRLNRVNILTITVVLFIVLFFGGVVRYGFSISTFLNLFNDNAYLIIATVGIFFVLLTGGIDISIASVLAFTCVLSASLLERGYAPLFVIILVLSIGVLFGGFQGFLIVHFKLQPFIVTLAGLFSMRALCSVISKAAIPIKHPLYLKIALAKFRFKVGGQNAKLYYYAILAIVVVLAAAYVLRYTKFGRTVYAVGGNELSASLMGLPVKRTKILVMPYPDFVPPWGEFSTVFIPWPDTLCRIWGWNWMPFHLP